jgi:hypothetical protein
MYYYVMFLREANVASGLFNILNIIPVLIVVSIWEKFANKTNKSVKAYLVLFGPRNKFVFSNYLIV